MGLWQILKGEQPGLLKSVLHYRNAGQFGEYLIDYALQSNGIEGERVVLTNLYLPMKGKTTEIDLLMLHEKGIFVIESKYYSGWIFGSEAQLKWTQCFRNGRKEHFYNPVKQNRTHIRALAEYLSMPEEAFSSYVVFSERCTLKKVPRYFDGDITVCHRHKMLCLMRKRIKDAPVVYSHTDIERLAGLLRPLTEVTKEEKQQHIEDLKTKCPFCGQPLVMRHGIRNAGKRARWTEYCLQNGKAKETFMDALEKAIDWTSMTESPPPESDSYLVTRKDPLMTTTAFFENGEWWDGPLCEWAWPEGMIIAWKPMPEPYNPVK